MNKKLMELRDRELAQRALNSWGRIAPELFTFAARNNQGAARHG